MNTVKEQPIGSEKKKSYPQPLQPGSRMETRHQVNPELERRKKRSRIIRSIKDWSVFTGYLAPSLIGVIVFFFLPLVMLVINSFMLAPTKPIYVGFKNYNKVLSNEAFKDASMNTLKFAMYAVPLAVILALLMALLLNTKLPGKSVFRSILLNPMMVPVASIVLIWQVFFSYNGVVNGWFFEWFGSEKIDWLKSDKSQIVIIIMFIWKNLGYNMVLFLAALNNIPTEILESAAMDGANAVKRFFSIKMYYLGSTIFFVSIMSLINSFKIFREVYLLTGDYPYDSLYMLQHFMNNSFKHLDYTKLSTSAIIMCVVMIFIVGIMFIAEALLDRNVEE